MGSQQFANDQVAKLNAMIEEIEPVRPPQISVPAMMASGYLHALHDAGLVSEEEWIRYDYAIDQKAGVFAQSEPITMSQTIHRSQWRLPQNLFEKIDQAAHANRRSANAELVARLESTFCDADGAALATENNLMLRALCEHFSIKAES